MDKTDFAFIAKMITGVTASAVTFFFGEADQWLFALVSFVALDYISGVSAAVINKELSSRSGFGGIMKKMLYLVIAAVAYIIDSTLCLSGVVRNLVIGFLVGNEGISILENCAECGLPIPPKLLEVFSQLKNNMNEKDK